MGKIFFYLSVIIWVGSACGADDKQVSIQTSVLQVIKGEKKLDSLENSQKIIAKHFKSFFNKPEKEIVFPQLAACTSALMVDPKSGNLLCILNCASILHFDKDQYEITDTTQLHKFHPIIMDVDCAYMCGDDIFMGVTKLYEEQKSGLYVWNRSSNTPHEAIGSPKEPVKKIIKYGDAFITCSWHEVRAWKKERDLYTYKRIHCNNMAGMQNAIIDANENLVVITDFRMDVYDLKDKNKKVYTSYIPSDCVYDLIVDSNKNLVLTMNQRCDFYNGCLCVFDKEYSVIHELSGHSATIGNLAIDTNNNMISGSWNGELFVWNNKYKCIKKLKEDIQAVRVMLIDSDGNLIAGLGNTIHIWNKKYEHQCSLDAHDGYITSLVIDSNGKLVSGGWDNKLCVWGNKKRSFSDLDIQMAAVLIKKVVQDNKKIGVRALTTEQKNNIWKRLEGLRVFLQDK